MGEIIFARPPPLLLISPGCFNLQVLVGWVCIAMLEHAIWLASTAPIARSSNTRDDRFCDLVGVEAADFAKELAPGQRGFVSRAIKLAVKQSMNEAG